MELYSEGPCSRYCVEIIVLFGTFALDTTRIFYIMQRLGLVTNMDSIFGNPMNLIGNISLGTLIVTSV